MESIDVSGPRPKRSINGEYRRVGTTKRNILVSTRTQNPPWPHPETSLKPPGFLLAPPALEPLWCTLVFSLGTPLGLLCTPGHPLGTVLGRPWSPGRYLGWTGLPWVIPEPLLGASWVPYGSVPGPALEPVRSFPGHLKDLLLPPLGSRWAFPGHALGKLAPGRSLGSLGLLLGQPPPPASPWGLCGVFLVLPWVPWIALGTPPWGHSGTSIGPSLGPSRPPRQIQVARPQLQIQTWDHIRGDALGNRHELNSHFDVEFPVHATHKKPAVFPRPIFFDTFPALFSRTNKRCKLTIFLTFWETLFLGAVPYFRHHKPRSLNIVKHMFWRPQAGSRRPGQRTCGYLVKQLFGI